MGISILGINTCFSHFNTLLLLPAQRHPTVVLSPLGDDPELPPFPPSNQEKGKEKKTQKPEDCLEFILLNKNGNICFLKKIKAQHLSFTVTTKTKLHN